MPPFPAKQYIEILVQTQQVSGALGDTRLTGPPDNTCRTTWDDVVPNGDIGALATTVRTRFEDCSRPDHPFGDNNDPAITNTILAYHRWSTQQSIHLHMRQDDPHEWHPVGPPALELYLQEDATTGAHSITSLRPTVPQPIPEPHIPPSPTKPQTHAQHEHGPPQQGHSPPSHKRAEPPNATTTVQQLDKPLTSRHVPDHYQLPRGGNHTKSTATTWGLPTGTIDWKKILPGKTAMEAMRLLKPHQVQLTQAMHLFITTQGTASIEGTALGDDDQTPQARPTQAIWISTTTGTDITVDPDPEWTAIHYSLDCAEGDPWLTEWQTRSAAEVNRLYNITLDNTLTPQAMEPAGRPARGHRDPTKHTFWHYPTTIHPEAVTQIKEALSLTLPDTHNAHQPGMFTIYANFPTDTGMVPQVAELPLPPTVTALAKAAQAIAHREGAPQDWTPNVLVEQRAHQNANKTQQAGRQIHPPIRDKDENLQPHSPWMVHFILEDHGDNRKSPGGANHTRPGAHAPQLHRPHLKYIRHLRRSTKVHVQTAGQHRRHSLHGVHRGTIRGPASPHPAPGLILAPTPPWEASAPSEHQTRGEQRYLRPRQPAPPPEHHKLCSRRRQDAPHRHGVPHPGSHHPPQNAGRHQKGPTPRH